MLSTFLAADYFKIPHIIFSLHHVLHDQPSVPMLLWYTYSVPYSNTLSYWGIYHEFSHTQVCTLSVLHDFTAPCHKHKHPLLLRCLLTLSSAKVSSMNSYCTSPYVCFHAILNYFFLSEPAPYTTYIPFHFLIKVFTVLHNLDFLHLLNLRFQTNAGIQTWDLNSMMQILYHLLELWYHESSLSQ